MRAVIDTNILVRALLNPGGSVGQPNRTIAACRDPKDNKFLEVAVADKADVLVTGDQDLAVLHPFEGIPILKPMDFLRLL